MCGTTALQEAKEALGTDALLNILDNRADGEVRDVQKDYITLLRDRLQALITEHEERLDGHDQEVEDWKKAFRDERDAKWKSQDEALELRDKVDELNRKLEDLQPTPAPDWPKDAPAEPDKPFLTDEELAELDVELRDH